MSDRAAMASHAEKLRRLASADPAMHADLEEELIHAQMVADFERCQAEGHQWHTCPACCDRACLRCGLPDQEWNDREREDP